MSRLQVLPVHELRWEDFERLCLRLQRSTLDISEVTVHGERQTAGVARMYGGRGQAQHGIDIYARDPLPLGVPAPERATVCLQARNVATVTEGELDVAVDDFLAGRWAAVSRKFVFATTATGVRTQHLDVTERRSREMAELGIELQVWDRESMSELLRSQPELIDDFFGRAWVEAFCGQRAAEALVARLDGLEVERLRSEMRDLYRAAFSVADSGQLMARRPGTSGPSLEERFVTLDVLPVAAPTTWLEEANPEMDENEEQGPRDASHERLEGQDGRVPHRGQTGGDWLDVSYVPSFSGLDLQMHGAAPANEWLGTASRQVVVGDPGAGKSTLLRRLVLDLLGPEPVWVDVARRWGDRLPVWLPFHFFTRRVEGGSGREASVVEAIRAWFEQHDFAELVPLVEKALRDDRLLLVVDGLDEWSSLTAGELAAAALETFVAARPVSIVMSTRPYGLQRVRLGHQWALAWVAQLCRTQQRALATPYFNAAAGEPSSRTRGTVELAVDEFFAEINDSADLSRIAGTPLFLVLLVGLRTTGGSLPARRFDVFDRAIELLVTEQPSRRRVAAMVAARDRRLTDRQLRAVLAHVAFRAQARGDFRLISQTQLESDLVEALTAPDLLALDRASAVERAAELAAVAEGDLGLLTRLGPQEIGFLHRSLQEQLAAEHVAARMPVNEQHDLLVGHLADERWREVLLAVLRLTQRPEERAALVSLVRAAVADTPTGVAAADLLAEMVAGPYELPGDLARELCDFLLDRVEAHPLLNHRASLVSHLVGATDNVVVGPAVAERLRRWTVQVTRPYGWVVRRLLRPPGEPVLPVELATAVEAFSHLDPDVVWEAARALVLRLADRDDDPALGAEVASVRAQVHAHLKDPTSDFCAAAALSVTCLLWPEEPDTQTAVTRSRASQSKALRVVAYAHLLGVLRQAVAGGDSGVHPSTEALAAHEVEWLRRSWPTRPDGDSDVAAIHLAAVVAVVRDDVEVRDRVVDVLTRWSGSELDAAWNVALGAYGDDPAVARLVAETLATHEYGWSSINLGRGGDALARTYGDGTRHQDIVAAGIERRLQAFDHRHRDRELFDLARVDHGPRMRQALLDQLDHSSFPHWSAAALQAHFSDDSEVQRRLRAALSGPRVDASRIAGVARRVLGEDEGRERLLALLDELGGEANDAARFDVIAHALAGYSESLTDLDERERLCAQAIPRLPATSWPDGDPQFELAVAFSDAPTAQRIVIDREAARRPYELLAPLLVAYRDDPAHRVELANEARAHLRTPPASVRMTINNLLAHGAAPAELILDACREWADEVSDEVKCMASLAFHRALREERLRGHVSDEEWGKALDHLGTVASSYGHDHEARRRAAWVGLCVLETLAPLAGRLETIGDSAPVGVSMSDPLHGPDLVLLEQLARSWTMLREELGEDLAARLAGIRGSRSPREPWSSLAWVAARHPALDAELRTAFAAAPTLIEDDAVLAWYVADPETTRSAATEAVLAGIAAENNLRGLAVRMAQDPEASGLDRDQLLAGLEAGRQATKPGFGDVTLECLAVLVPRRPDVQQVFRGLARRLGMPGAGPPTDADAAVFVHPQTYFAVVYAAAPSESVSWWISRDLARVSERGMPYFDEPTLIRHVRRRLLTDPAALAAVRRTAADTQTPLALAVPLVVLLSSVTGADAQEREPIDQCLARLDANGEPLMVRDVVLGHTVSAKVSLLHSVTARPD